MAQRRTKRPARRPKAAALRPETALPEPGRNGSSGLLVVPQRQAGVRVTEDTALTLGAVFACVRVISETLASLPWGVFKRRDDGGRDAVPQHPADWLLRFQANPETPAYFWRETIVAHALLWGNGYAEVERDGAGRVVWLWLLTPDRVTPYRDDAGRIAYEVRNPDRSSTDLPAEDVYHLRGPGYDGLVGYSIVKLAARTIGLGISLDDAAGSLSANDSTPGGILTHPGRLTPEAAKNLRDSWNLRHAGSSNRRTVAVLEEGMSWAQTGLPPEDAQLVQSRQFTPAEICRWFRVQPHKIADLSKSTNNNIEYQGTEFTTDTLLPWARRLESEADVKLFGPVQRGLFFTKVNFLGLLRGDSAARTAFYTALYDRGVLNVNEIREKEDMNPIGTDGDQRFVPMNMALLEDAGKPPPAPPAPPPPETPAPADATPDAQAAMAPVLEDACRRMLRREEHRMADALRRLGPQGMPGWLNGFVIEHTDYAREALAPACVALANLVGGPKQAAHDGLEVFLRGHAAGLRSRDMTPQPADVAARLRACVLTAARLYSPDQERDDQGRFDGGGGDGGGDSSGGDGGGGGPAGATQPPAAKVFEQTPADRELHPGVVVTKAEGKEWVLKLRAGQGDKQAVEAEVRAGKMAEHAGVAVVGVHPMTISGRPFLVSEFTPGKALSGMTKDEQHAAIQSVSPKDVDRHALFDYAMGNSDPNHGNYLIHEGKMTAIDKERTLSNGQGSRTGWRPSEILHAAAAANGQTLGDRPFAKSEVQHMATAAGKIADQLHAEGRTKDAAGVRGRAEVLGKLAGLANPTAADLSDLGRAADKSQPSPGIAGRIKGWFGK